MRDHEDRIRAAGAGIAAVGTGDAEYGRRFREQAGIGFPLLVDPELRSYRVLGVGHGRVADTLRPRMVVGGARALRRGARQARAGPHPLLLGATHVVEPGGRVPFAWLDGDYADAAPLPEVLAALPSC